MLQHTFTWRRRHSCAHTDIHSQRFPAGNQTRDNLFCHTLISTSLPLFPVSCYSSSSFSSLVFSPPLKDSISNLNIPLMSPLLLLKILSPNQIHQLALTLLLLHFALVSVKPRKLDLLSGSLSSSSSSSFPLCARTPSLLSVVREGFSVHFPPSVSLSASSSLLSLLRMTSLPSVISPPSLVVSRGLLLFFCSGFQAACPPVAPLLLLLLRHSSVHAAGEPVTDESACLSLC